MTGATPDRERFARTALSFVAEPGDLVVGALLRAGSPAEAFAAICDGRRRRRSTRPGAAASPGLAWAIERWVARLGSVPMVTGGRRTLIARLAGQLRCYLPEQSDETWARLRDLGARRARLIAEQTAQLQQMRDLLECAWPAVLDAARQPFKSTTWQAALAVALTRAVAGDLSRVTRLGGRRFDAAVRRQVARWDAVHPWQKIIDGVSAACADPAGVTVMRRGALERVGLLLADWRDTQAGLAGTEQRMVTVLGELGLAELATSITGLSAVGAASVLAETGDLARFTTGRAVVKHAGLAPRQKASGTYTGRTRTTGQGRPGLRLAAWRAVWAR